MDSNHNKKRMNLENDRISSLPDDLIHKILSVIGIKQAIETSVLSSKWRFIWTSMSNLNFSSEDFRTLPEFSQFVTHVLSRRNNLADIFSIKLRFRGDVSEEFVKQIMNYAFSHNIQQLDVACLLENDIEFPLSLFRSKSLKHLSLTKEVVYQGLSMRSFLCSSLKTTSTWELPALTTLYLNDVILCCDDDNNDKCFPLFSKCANLENLTLKKCKKKGLDTLRICHPRLSNLVVENDHEGWKVFNVVTPQLKNLTISNWSLEHYVISAPELASFHYKGSHPLQLSTDGFHSLEKVDLCISSRDDVDAIGIVLLLQQLQSVEFLTLNLEIVELLSSYVELIADQPSPFTKLKMLKIYPANVDSEEDEQTRVSMSTEVKNYLLDGSPSATFTMVSREEIRATRNTKLAHNLMKKVRVLLDEEKANIETNRAHMERVKEQVENQLQIEGRMTQINKCWKDLSMQIEQGKEKTSEIISKLQDIKAILTKLPTSKRAEMQTCFSCLCAEADTLVSKIIEHVKIQCDMKGSFFGVCFHELASTSQSPS